jgi:nitrite reductase/ring-hydroxylating ferredoxin subunit
MLVRVCRVGDVGPGTTAGFPVAGLVFPVMIANVAGRLLAASSICPHEDVSLLDGDLDGAIVTCPGHGYEFDMETGRCAHDRSLQLGRFEVRVVGDDVYIEVDLVRGPR